MHISLAFEADLLPAPLFKPLYSTGCGVTTNKNAEFEIYKSETVLGLAIEWSTKRHHAGASLRISFAGITAQATFYDSRHWDDQNNKWMETE